MRNSQGPKLALLTQFSVLGKTHLNVGDWWEGFLRIGVLRVQREQRRDPKRDTGWYGFWFNPERDPRHDNNEASGNVRVEQVVAQTSPERHDNFETREIAL